MKYALLTLCIMNCALCITSSAQVQVVKFDYLDKIMHSNNDTTYVINFWATWCNPCVKELPYFKKLREDYLDKKVSVILLSMDFRRDAHTRVESIVAKNNIKNRVLLLDETDYNSWIDKVDSSWSGAIPATLICKGKVKVLYQKEFTSYLALENIVKPFLQ
jgi:thiol-disulfide isomerase/thioredoxin